MDNFAVSEIVGFDPVKIMVCRMQGKSENHQISGLWMGENGYIL
jgi:hypothetical protein